MVPRKAFIKPFETPQRDAKIKIEASFLSSSGIGTVRVNDFTTSVFLFS